MEHLFRIILFLTGIINFLPMLGVFSPSKMEKAYGIPIEDKNLELLLRHRAMLFGIVGGLMIFSALTKSNYDIATVIGVISMGSYAMLYFMIGNINESLKKVMKIDVFALILLVLGYILKFL